MSHVLTLVILAHLAMCVEYVLPNVFFLFWFVSGLCLSYLTFVNKQGATKGQVCRMSNIVKYKIRISVSALVRFH